MALIAQSRLGAVQCASIRYRLSAFEKVVVLGGTGFVGRTVAELALARGHAVTCLSRRGAPEGKEALPGATYVQGDATDPAVVSQVLQGCDAVVHAVGLLFDSTTPGGGSLNLIVSGSKSRPDEVFGGGVTCTC